MDIKVSEELFSAYNLKNDLNANPIVLESVLEDLLAVNDDISFDSDEHQQDVLDFKTEVVEATGTSWYSNKFLVCCYAYRLCC